MLGLGSNAKDNVSQSKELLKYKRKVLRCTTVLYNKDKM